jgi:hypothetical protein
MVDQLKIYPLWSNFIYFIAGIYALGIGIYNKNILFVIYGILIILTGIFSIVYHMYTPSWTGNVEIINTNTFETYLKLDQSFALLIVIYSLLFFIYRLYVFNNNRKLLFDFNFLLALLFIIFAFIFYGISHNHFTKTNDCVKQKCINVNLDAYDIFHSNWHIFTSIALIFWINVLFNTYKYSKIK